MVRLGFIVVDPHPGPRNDTRGRVRYRTVTRGRECGENYGLCGEEVVEAFLVVKLSLMVLDWLLNISSD